MRYGSVCSGIEAASLAFEPLGFKPAWFSEIDPFASALLSQRYPSVVNLGDMRIIGEQHGPIDILVGGTACQSFSIVGSRQGLDDHRGELTLHYAKLTSVLRPTWIIWENVPGVLSADKGRAFGNFIELLAECGFGICWRVLDCQDFGIAQRRRRLFLVGHCGGRWERAAAVLLEARANQEDVRPSSTSRKRSIARSIEGIRDEPIGWTGDTTPKFASGVSPTLRAYQGGEGTGLARNGRARRFTPREMERLMGFPDGWTDINYKGRPASDQQRKTVLGNAFPVPVLRWIGQRIIHIEEMNIVQ